LADPGLAGEEVTLYAQGRRLPLAGSPALSEQQLLKEIRALQHLLSNQITVAAGYAELLHVDSSLDSSLEPTVASIAAATMEAARTLVQLQVLTHTLEGKMLTHEEDGANAAGDVRRAQQ
jgi:hypothetical protein